MNSSDPQGELDREDEEAAERRASTSEEFPTNITRSTQDLTIGGSEKKPDAPKHARVDHQQSESSPMASSVEGTSNAEQAVVNQERALETGEESPG